MLIINADDYGLSSAVTLAVLEAFSQGLCSSSTIVANGADFQQAVELAHARHLAPRLGIHLNLVEGTPLTQGIRRIPRFCNADGQFSGHLTANWGVSWRLPRSEQELMAQELRAQVAVCRKARLLLTHADSHQCVHTRWEIWRVVGPLLKECGITRVRLSQNCVPSLSLPKTLYKWAFNAQLRAGGFRTADYFGSAADVLHLYKTRVQGSNALVEAMVHPLFGDKDRLMDIHSASLAALVHAIPGWQHAVSYDDLP